MKIPEEEKQRIARKTAKPMLYLAMVAMSMLFAAFTSAYILKRGDPDWIVVPLPEMFYYSTAIILISSVSMWLAHRSAKRNNFSGVTGGILITLLLGLAFVFTQFRAYSELVSQGLFIGGGGSRAAISFLYVISGAHLLHLFGGIMVLLVVCKKSFSNFYHSKNLLGLQLCSIYWHFLDVLWVYLFVFLYFAR